MSSYQHLRTCGCGLVASSGVVQVVMVTRWGSPDEEDDSDGLQQSGLIHFDWNGRIDGRLYNEAMSR